LSLASKFQNGPFVSALEKPCKEKGMNLTLKVFDFPTFGFGFYFIKKAFVLMFDIHQGPVMRPA
jgi:S-formylglutathione hydrolase FrmB